MANITTTDAVSDTFADREPFISMRPVTIILVGLLVSIQYPLWNGKKGWSAVSELEGRVVAARSQVERLEARNGRLASEVTDLQKGVAAVEERARQELGMIRQGEIYVQIIPRQAAPVDMTPGSKGEKISGSHAMAADASN